MEKIEAMALLERAMKELTNKDRSTWVRRDIDPIVDDLLEIWGFLNEN